MSRLDVVFKSGRKALIGYLTVGYPTLDATPGLVEQLAVAGCDMIELGIPFSDPMADGATIQQASHQALQNGVTPAFCLEVAAKIGRRSAIPLLFMSYLNPILSYGIEGFCRTSLEAGISGLIIPDLPPEEGVLSGMAPTEAGLPLVYMLAPTSTDERIKLVGERSCGFIYVVSVAGVTGTRNELSPGFAGFIARLRVGTQLPLCVGFGISTPEQAWEVTRLADGVIIGSRIVQLVGSDPSGQSAARFVADVRKAIG